MSDKKTTITPSDLPEFDLSSIQFGLPDKKDIKGKGEIEDTDPDPDPDPKPDPKPVTVKKKEEEPADDRVIEVEDDNDFSDFNFDKEDKTEEAPSTLFETMMEMGLIMVPEDFKFDGTEDSLQEAINHDFNLRQEMAVQEIESKIEDAGIREIVAAGLKGGKFLDIVEFVSDKRKEVAIEDLDLNKEENARSYLTEVYKARGIKLSKIEALLDAAEADDTLIPDAKEERDAEVAVLKEKRKKAADAAKKAQDEDRKQRLEYEQKFTQALTKAEMPTSKKTAVLSAVQNVVSVNGNQMPEWHYKLLQIQNKPEDFIALLDILAGYDPKKGLGKPAKAASGAADDKDKSTKSLLNKLAGETKGTKIGGGRNAGKEDEQRSIPDDPYKRRTRVI